MTTAPYEVIGRQPAVIYITPSAINPWYGTIIEGRRFTTQQEYQLLKRGIDPVTVEGMAVRRQATDREMWFPPSKPAPVFEFECPVIHRRPDGRVKILSPVGDAKIVFGDGWVRRPRKPRILI